MLDCFRYEFQQSKETVNQSSVAKQCPKDAKSLISITHVVCNVPRPSGGKLESQALVDLGLLSVTSFLNTTREALLWTASVTTASRTHTQSTKTWCGSSLPLAKFTGQHAQQVSM